MSNHLSKHHKEVWEAYSETRSRVATVATKAKEEEKAACEMENSEVRFYDVRSRKGRLPFLKKANCCEMHFSLICIVLFRFCLMSQNLQRTGWTVDSDPRAEAAHLGIISQMVLDFQLLSMVTNKGFLIDKRLTMPNLQIQM